MRFRLRSGRTIHYTTRGIGRTMVLLHPVGLNGAFWSPVIALLENDLRLITPDVRGHGESDIASGPFTIDDLADDVIELVDGIGGPDPVFVVGCSLGGMIAQGVALKGSHRLAGVVVANASHMRSDEGRAMMDRRAAEATRGMPTVIDASLSRWFDATFKADDGKDVIARTREWLLSADPVVHSNAWHAIRDLDFGDRLQSVATPALVVGGTRDRSVSPEVAQRVARSFANGRYEEIDAGHLTPLERPELFAAALRRFTATVA